MKKVLHKVLPMVEQIHPYPFWVFVGFLYASILAFAACGAILWFPDLLTMPQTAYMVGQQLFQTGVSLFTIGGVTGPVMDLIIQHDLPKN